MNNIMSKLGSLELITIIFWMVFWLANGLAKLIPGVHIGIKFAPKGEMNPFAGTLDKMGWGTGLGDFAFYFTGVVELLLGIVFLWALIQFIMGSGARRSWIFFGLFFSALIFTVFTFANVVTAARPTPLIWHTTYFAIVGVSWLVMVAQSYYDQISSDE